MEERSIYTKMEKLMGRVKLNLVEYAHFFKKKLKLYEITREYNVSVYELGHQFYTTAKSGLEDIKVFTPSIERLRELEHSLINLREELSHRAEKQSPGTGKEE